MMVLVVRKHFMVKTELTSDLFLWLIATDAADWCGDQIPDSFHNILTC